jgi:hypothetical protein
MTLEARIHKLEASLAAKEKFSLWFHRAKAAGGFVPYWERELKGSMAPFEWCEDEEAYLLFRLVNDVNFTILNNTSKNQDLRSFAHCALDGVVRRISRPDRSGALVPVRAIPEIATRVGKFVCAKFKSLWEEALLMASAIDVISETYLGGEDILFPDTRAMLNAEVSNLRTTAYVYDPITDWLEIEPLVLKEVAPGSPIVHAKANQIVLISRADALVFSSDLRKFKDALQRAFPEYCGLCSPSERSTSVRADRSRAMTGGRAPETDRRSSPELF